MVPTLTASMADAADAADGGAALPTSGLVLALLGLRRPSPRMTHGGRQGGAVAVAEDAVADAVADDRSSTTS